MPDPQIFVYSPNTRAGVVDNGVFMEPVTRCTFDESLVDQFIENYPDAIYFFAYFTITTEGI